MPAQTTDRVPLVTYGMFDTAPPLFYVITDPTTGEPFDFTQTPNARVFITVAHALWSTFFVTRSPIVDRAQCVIGDPVAGEVAWVPQADDLNVPGMFQFSFEVDLLGDATEVFTQKSLSYDHIRVQAPPGGRHRKSLLEDVGPA